MRRVSTLVCAVRTKLSTHPASIHGTGGLSRLNNPTAAGSNALGVSVVRFTGAKYARIPSLTGCINARIVLFPLMQAAPPESNRSAMWPNASAACRRFSGPPISALSRRSSFPAAPPVIACNRTRGPTPARQMLRSSISISVSCRPRSALLLPSEPSTRYSTVHSSRCNAICPDAAVIAHSAPQLTQNTPSSKSCTPERSFSFTRIPGRVVPFTVIVRDGFNCASRFRNAM